jgi:hypothetical protein
MLSGHTIPTINFLSLLFFHEHLVTSDDAALLQNKGNRRADPAIRAVAAMDCIDISRLAGLLLLPMNDALFRRLLLGTLL